jgi:hypothetical protein
MDTPDDEHEETRAERRARAQGVGEYFTRAAVAAGYDVRPRAGGRKRLADDLVLSLTTVTRTLDGETMPLPSQLIKWARVLELDYQTMLVESGLLPPESAPAARIREVPSAPLAPEQALDAWGVTDPQIRELLLSNIQTGLAMQQKIDDQAAGRGTAARG